MTGKSITRRAPIFLGPTVLPAFLSSGSSCPSHQPYRLISSYSKQKKNAEAEAGDTLRNRKVLRGVA